VVLILSTVHGHTYKSPFELLDVENYTNSLSIKFDENISVKATPSILPTTGWVELHFEGIEAPKHDDWVGVYSPANVDIKTTAPVKFKYASASADYIKHGRGSLKFKLINMRDNYRFVFFRDGTKHPVAVAKSNVVGFLNYDAPLHGRLALTGKPNEMRVTWVSKHTSNPQVQWGVRSGVYTSSASATSYSYTAEDLCGKPANSFGWRDPGIIHTAVMTNLSPKQCYHYRYGDDKSGGWSKELSFCASPNSNPQQGVRLAAYGDMGKAEVDDSREHWEEYPSLNTTKNVLKRIANLDLVLHIGDISYAVGYAAQWDEWLDQVHPIAAKVPYMTCDGNHERDFLDSGAHYNGTDSGGECGVPYESHLPMPTPAKDKTWYSFNFGNIHFVLMSTEHNFDIGSEQYRFLENDLASVNRSNTPWVIFSGHRPMYIDSTAWDGPASDQMVAEELRRNVESLLFKYKVDLALWGHHHSYQRSCPVYQQKCTDKAPVHVVIGMAGMGLSQNIEDKQPDWSLYVDDQEYGYSIIQTTETSLHMEYFNNENVLKDKFTLTH